MDKPTINNIDLSKNDTSALKDALEILAKSSPDYLVIDMMTKIKEELKRRNDE